MSGIPFSCAPLKVNAGGKEYVDNTELDLAGMIDDLKKHKGKSGTSCPNVGEWLEAFGDEEAIFGITITKHVSGSYNAARQAAQSYMDEHPGRKVFIFDSLSAGPALMMIADKILECEKAGMDFEATKDAVLEYQNHNHTLFCLESMMNLARNGRVSLAVAKIASIIGIRVLGEAKGGQLAPAHKPRGAKGATAKILDMLKERGFRDGNILRIAHCFAEEAAVAVREKVLAEFPRAKLILEPTGALCSFYAEAGGLIIGFEGNFNAENDYRKF
jgi:DegV family protein with EDD domain